MSLVDNLLGKYGAKLDTLNEVERETFFTMLKTVESKQLSVDKIKAFIRELISGVEKELATTPEVEYYFAGLWSRPNRQHVFLKARLQNYLLIENFVTSPERAKKALDEAMSRVQDKPERVI